MEKNPKWIYINFNPYKQHINDCAVRAISGATGLDYKEVCKRLGVRFQPNKGLARNIGISLDAIKSKFNDYFDIVEDYYDNYEYVPDEFKGSKEDAYIRKFEQLNGIDAISNTTLNEFCDEFAGQGPFLVGLVGNPNAKNPKCRNKRDGHIVYANLSPYAKRQGFIDTFDSGDMLVDSYMRVSKREPKNSPLHWKYDYGKKQFIV